MTAAKSTRSKRTTAAEELAELREVIEELVHHVACLTQAVDELADQVQGQSKVLREGGFSPTPRLTSMPLDPTTDEWELNRCSADDLPDFTQPPTPAVPSQQQLFDVTEAESSLD